MTPQELPWDQFFRQWERVYKQDQHVTIIGPTDCGKTTLTKRLIQPRGHVVGFGIKYKDTSLDDLLKQDWHRVDRWKLKPRSARRILLWPKADDPEEAPKLHRERFAEALHDIFKVGAWTVWSDELRYLTDMCGLRKLYQHMYITSRSNNISLVSAAQRPAFVPLEAYSSAQHLFLYKTGDERDIVRIGGLNGTSAKQVAGTVADLPFHTFLYVNQRTGQQIISHVEL